jgi:hypothetical protein
MEHMKELASPLLIHGFNRTGIAIRGVSRPARVVSFVLAPRDHREPLEEYVEELRRLFGNESVEKRSMCTTIPAVAQFFRPEQPRSRRVRAA